MAEALMVCSRLRRHGGHVDEMLADAGNRIMTMRFTGKRESNIWVAIV
jgi:hypothetical protein